MMSLRSSLVVFLLVVFLTVYGDAAGTCDIQDDNPCRCKSGNFSVDFRSSFKTSKNISNDKYFYILSPCSPISCGSSNGGSAVNVACQYNPKTNENYSLGKITQATYTVHNATSFSVFFDDGDKYKDPDNNKEYTRTTRITGTIGKEANVNFTEETDDAVNLKGIYNFNVKIKRSSGNIAGVVGIVIIVLVLVAVLAYFIIGAIVMYTVKGARGVEVIPNYTFWKSLPFLIKDGCLLTISPCTTKCGREKGYTSL